MKKQSATGLFFSMFLRAVVIILGIVILVFGTVFLVKVIKGGKKSANKAPATTVGVNVLTEAEVKDDLLSAEPTEATEEMTTEAAVDSSEDKAIKILVLNSTNVKGLAGRWCGRLGENGYANTTASDYSDPQQTTKIVAKTDGVGSDLVQYFNGATYEVGTVTSGVSISTEEYDVVIIVGSNDNDQ